MREFDQTKDISISPKTGGNGMPSSTGKDLADQLLKRTEQGRIAVLGSFGVEKQAIASHLLPPFVTMVIEKEEKELMEFKESAEVLEELETWDKGLTKPRRALGEANAKF